MEAQDFKVKLKTPITVGDKTFSEVDLSGLEGLTGDDVLNCQREAEAMKGNVVLVRRLDPYFQVEVAAKLSGIGAGVLKKLPAREFERVLNMVRDFFSDSD